MLRLALMFFVVAAVAALFGFGGVAAVSGEIARVIFYVFIVLLAVSLIFGAIDRRAGPTM